MKTTAIKIEGQIISSEIFDKIDSADIKGQAPIDFGFESNTKVKDEIQRAWANAKDQWKIFNRNIEKLKDEDTGTSETRKHWVIPFLDNLGYQLNLGRAETVNEKSYAISHRAANIDDFPVHIVSYKDSLDRRREGTGPRLSPHALIQEYLNLTEHLYSLVTNGYQLRVLRDSGKLIRLTYLEFDLQKMMEEDLYAEFSILYRIIHATRMPQKMDEGDLSLIEQYHQDSLEAGARIRDRLSEAVEKSIQLLAVGFLNNRNNDELRRQIEENLLDEQKLYQYLLRFIYRVLFLMVIEERDIVYSESGEDTRYHKDIYYDNYSITRLRRLSEKIFFFDDKLNDLWIQLRNTFKIFGDETLAAKLKLYPLDGELFDFDALGILSESDLDNRSLLKCIRNLSQFEDKETHSSTRVNYSALNVEEFGSVYEGLLEKDPSITGQGSSYKFTFVKGNERSSSGSHYTPEELVQPLIKHSLDYVIEDKIKAGKTKEEKETNLLSIKVCDVACGSGHILLSAARRIAQELTKVRTGEDQPAPAPFREATRDVINNCIYGVDKNPLAVELCKVALWLEAHNPGMPLNFLDNKIRCGDSIVGLARIEELQNGIAAEAFKTLPGDDKTIAAELRNKNKAELKQRKYVDVQLMLEKHKGIAEKFSSFNRLPDNTVKMVARKKKEYAELRGAEWWKLKELADIKTAQFFIPKTRENKNLLTTDTEYIQLAAGKTKAGLERKIAAAMAAGTEKKFFHWFLQFPEVMQNGGFDCILGNPPFLGGSKISGLYGNSYFQWISTNFEGSGGMSDLVGYFLRRNFFLLMENGFTSIITTNTIAQGDTREASLKYIDEKFQSDIIFAKDSLQWPGKASVIVSLVSLFRGKWSRDFILNDKSVDTINSYLNSTTENYVSEKLRQNSDQSFTGSKVYGEGFVLAKNEATKLLENNKNKEVIFPYMNGLDINSNPSIMPSRFVINFFDWSLNKSKSNYPDCFNIIEKKVKPVREQLINNAKAKEKWWLYERPRSELYDMMKELKHVLICAMASKYVCFVFSSTTFIYMQMVCIFRISEFSKFSCMSSSFHVAWAWKNSSKLGHGTITYSLTDCYQTFPFPQDITKETEEELEKIGEEYHEFRRQLMLDMQLGLTKTYNLFHNPEIRANNTVAAEETREFKQAKLQIPLEDALIRIEKLRSLHKQMDEAVLKAYGWQDVDLAHNFYEVDYLPENDRVRYTISPEARKEVLKRLLELNHKIHEEEVKAGLWDKKVKNKKSAKLSTAKTKKDTDTQDLFGG